MSVYISFSLRYELLATGRLQGIVLHKQNFSPASLQTEAVNTTEPKNVKRHVRTVCLYPMLGH